MDMSIIYPEQFRLYNEQAQLRGEKIIGGSHWNNMAREERIVYFEEMFGPGSWLRQIQKVYERGTVKNSPEPQIFSHSRWNTLLDSTFSELRKLASLKGGEYSGDEDRLANFRRNAEALGLKKEQIWGVYAAKHWDALMQYIKDLGENKERTRLESLQSRVDDLLVYLLLFKAMLIESEHATEGTK